MKNIYENSAVMEKKGSITAFYRIKVAKSYSNGVKVVDKGKKEE